jgi:hypothetical protein
LDRAALVRIRHRHGGKFRPGFQHGLHLCEIVRQHGIHEPLHSHAVDIGFEFGPAVKPIASGDDQLRVMQREVRGVRVVIVGADFRDRFLLTGDKALQQLFRLPLQLFEIRMLAQPSCRYFRFQVSSFRLRPVSAGSGRKEFIETSD